MESQLKTLQTLITKIESENDTESLNALKWAVSTIQSTTQQVNELKMKQDDRERKLITTFHAYDLEYLVNRSDFIYEIRNDKALVDYIDKRIFKHMVSKPRASVRILILGNWLICEHGNIIINVNDLIENGKPNRDILIDFIIDKMRKAKQKDLV